MNYKLERVESIKQFLIAHKKTLAVAESVTSGHLQVVFTQVKNASDFFQGGITAYNYGQKCRHLHIEPIHALKDNCVSLGIAGQMALHAGKMFLSDYGIGITGYASRVPEDGINDLFAFAAISLNDKVLVAKKITPSVDGEGFDVQVNYVNQICDLFCSLLGT